MRMGREVGSMRLRGIALQRDLPGESNVQMGSGLSRDGVAAVCKPRRVQQGGMHEWLMGPWTFLLETDHGS